MGDKMESPKFEKTSQAEKVALFLEKWRTVLIVVLALVIAVIVGVSIFNAVHSSNDKAVIGEVDKIAYELTENSAKLSSEELEVRRENALSKLKPYLSKGCVGGSAANRLQAEILYSKKDYKNASEYYLSAAKKNSSAYTCPLDYYNAASCFETLGDYENAAKYYEKAAEFKEYIQAERAYFSLGRVKEASGDVEGAKKAYTSLVDKFASGEWTNLAKSRLIFLGQNQ